MRHSYRIDGWSRTSSRRREKDDIDEDDHKFGFRMEGSVMDDHDDDVEMEDSKNDDYYDDVDGDRSCCNEENLALSLDTLHDVHL